MCLNIGIDIDDVLWDLVSTWIRIFQESEFLKNNVNKNPVKLITKESINEWDIFKVICDFYQEQGIYFLDKAKAKEYFFSMLDNPDIWESVEFYDINKALKNILDSEHNVYFVTASTSPISFARKCERLLSEFPCIEKDSIISIKDKSLLKLDVMVDDYMGNLNFKYNYLIEQPWNREVEFSNAKKVSSLSQAVEDILNGGYNFICT